MPVELPTLDVTERDRDKAREQFGGRPTSLIVGCDAQDAFMVKAVAELICRERQLLAVIEERDHALRELAKQDVRMFKETQS